MACFYSDIQLRYFIFIDYIFIYRFLLESSYQDHIQRKSVLIKYQCRHCSRRPLIFYNRCNLLSHIRSHTVRTATINVSDLWVEPLPLSFYKIKKDNPSCEPIAPAPAEETPQSDKTPPSERTPQPDNVPQNTPQPDNTPQLDSAPQSVNTNQSNSNNYSGVNSSICSDCKTDITSSGILYKDRASHYMRYTNQVYACPICLFNLPTVCGLRAHLRLHLKIPPFYCPECGMQMNHKSVIYPYTHGCEGFNMMRATARSQCPIPKCNLFHPNHFKKHMTENHFKLIYKCSICVVACFNESTMIKHAKTHKHEICPQRFYQCDLCPGRLVMLNHTDRHIRSHKQNPTYPCWTCNRTFKLVSSLMNHYVEEHCQYGEDVKKMLFASFVMTDEARTLTDQPAKKIYRVLKRCDQCLRSFTYKCQYEDINILPNSCPYKCAPSAKSSAKNTFIRCPLCKNNIDQTWEVIKEHFAANHKEHRCLDAKISIQKMNGKKYVNADNISKKNKVQDGGKVKKRTRRARQKRQSNSKMEVKIMPNEIKATPNSHVCGKCQHEYETKELLEDHILSHRDPCMAYQCMECGECFVVKTSFATHLLLKHDISDVDKYINEKKCYNENALITKCADNVVEEPLKENQCKICRDQFECSEDLEKHFRVHGMAFLIKNSLCKPNNS